MKLEDIFKDIDTYVICSTLNQIVNYIPIKLMKNTIKSEKIEMFNITMRDESKESDDFRKFDFKRFDNEKWDKNLIDCLNQSDINYINYSENNYIKIDRNEIYDYIEENDNNKVGVDINKQLNIQESKGEGKDDLNKLKSEPRKRTILWNITGGQRSTIMAIQKYIIDNKRCNDYIMYLEGNSNAIICGSLDKNKSFKYDRIEEKYGIEDLNLDTVFKLAGFQIRNYDKKDNLLKTDYKDEKTQKEFELCGKFYKYYKDKNSDLGKILRKNLPLLNKKKGNSEDKVDNFWESINGYEEFNSSDKNILMNLKGKSNTKFGYILEYMTIHAIKEQLDKNSELKDYFIELCHSINLDKFRNSFKKENTRELCEFDIVLLSKSGQVVIFECKSGTMSSDVGKSRQYTGYAAAGVYGKPILITPLLKDDRKHVYEKFEKKYTNNKITSDIECDSAVIEALCAAARANMEVWGIDEIGEKLKELYRESM